MCSAKHSFLDSSTIQPLPEAFVDQHPLDNQYSAPSQVGSTSYSANAESVFGTDQRVQVTDTLNDPWRRIGYITSSVGTGTGFMISPYHFMTAGHVVYDLAQGWASNVQVSLAQNDSSRFYGTAGVTYFTSNSAWTQNKDAAHDWAILTLDRNIGNFTGWMGLSAQSDSYFTNLNITTAGYPGDQPDGQMFRASGTVKQISAGQLFYNDTLDTYGGQSGSPVWASNNRDYAVGVHAYGDSGNGFNAATRIRSYIIDQFNSRKSQDDAQRRPVDRPDLVDYDNWFDTNLGGISTTLLKPGDSFSVTNYPRNNGTAASGDFTVNFYASTDTDVTDSGGSHYLIGSTTVGSLNPFTWGTATWTGAFPEIPSGNYYTVAFIDPTASITEFDDSATSNQRVIGSPLSVLKPPSNILIYDLQSSYVKNSTISLSQVYTYDEDGYSDLNYVDFWLQRPDGTWLDVSDATEFSPWSQDSDWGITNYSLSLADMPTGSYTLWAKAYDNQGYSSAEYTWNFSVVPPANLTLVGTAANDTLTGDDGNDRITGRGGNDLLVGKSGNDKLTGNTGLDKLTGGPGADQFIFDTGAAFKALTMGIDLVTDFELGTDKITLDKTTFTSLSRLSFASVSSLTQARTHSALITYVRETGALYYNQNGAARGSGSGGQFADLSNGLNLAATNLSLVA